MFPLMSFQDAFLKAMESLYDKETAVMMAVLSNSRSEVNQTGAMATRDMEELKGIQYYYYYIDYRVLRKILRQWSIHFYSVEENMESYIYCSIINECCLCCCYNCHCILFSKHQFTRQRIPFSPKYFPV